MSMVWVSRTDFKMLLMKGDCACNETENPFIHQWRGTGLHNLAGPAPCSPFRFNELCLKCSINCSMVSNDCKETKQAKWNC